MSAEFHESYQRWIERVFEPIQSAVTEFASAQGLRLVKCTYGAKGWDLVGPHPKGGHLVLLLRYDPVVGLRIGSVWQVGRVEESVFHTHARKMRRCRIVPKAVAARLEEELDALLAAEYGNWTHTRPIPSIGTSPRTASPRLPDS